MSCRSGLLLIVVCTIYITGCWSTEEYITAYVKKALTNTRCESVAAIRDVCDIKWHVPHNAATNYNASIKEIRKLISASSIVYGLSPSEAIRCRKSYEEMLCKTTFPVCDPKKMVLSYGNGTERCKMAEKACPNVYIGGCEYSPTGDQSILVNPSQKCVSLETDTSTICPNFTLKVPMESTRYLGIYIDKALSNYAREIDKVAKNYTGMETCVRNYKEVLCRLIESCSSDGYYSLRLIGKEECDEKISCLKSAGIDGVLTSVCAILPNTKGLKNFTIKNPFMDESPTPATTHQTDTVKEATPANKVVTKELLTEISIEDKELVEPTENAPVKPGSDKSRKNETSFNSRSAGNTNKVLSLFTRGLSILTLVFYQITF